MQLFLIYLVTDQSWYIPPIVDPDDPEIRNSDNTVLFLISCFQYIMIAVILSVGPPYRQPMAENGFPNCASRLMEVPFMVTIVISVLFTTITILFPPAWLASILQLTEMSISFSFLLLAVAIVNFGLSWLSEKFIVVQIRMALDRVSAWQRKRKRRGGKPKVKRYQAVEDGML